MQQQQQLLSLLVESIHILATHIADTPHPNVNINNAAFMLLLQGPLLWLWP
jgi:hypothetical protein